MYDRLDGGERGRGKTVIARLFAFRSNWLRRLFKASPDRGWQRYRASGDTREALSAGAGRVGALRFSIDHAITAGEFFFLDGWLLGPETRDIRFEVSSRKGLCGGVAFRYERYDVNDAFKLPRSFPHRHLGFRIFGRLVPPSEPVVGLSIVGAREGAASLVDLLCTLPLRMEAGESAEVWQPLLESTRRHLPISGADLENAALLLNQIRSRDLARNKPPAFPACSGEAVDVLILARHRPEVTQMNVTLIQQAVPAGARIFVVSVEGYASRYSSLSSAAIAQEQGVSLQYLSTPEALPSSVVITGFLQSDHAPTAVIVMDDVFIAPCLAALSATIRQGRSLVVPRVRQLAPTPAIEPALEVSSAASRDILGRDFCPLGAMVLGERDGIAVDILRQYDGRGFVLEDLFNANDGKFLISDKPCLDLLSEDQSGDANYFAAAPDASIVRNM